jgi:hypothetical protein
MQIVAAESPNVLIIVADDVGYDAFGRTGSKSSRTHITGMCLGLAEFHMACLQSG